MAISFSWLKKDERFLSAMRKMSLNISLEASELEFVLACAVLFLREYSNDKRKRPYFEIAYYIVLKCAVNNNLYEPILDVSSNFGLYPISSYIKRNSLFSGGGVSDFSLEYQLERFKHGAIIETYEQRQSREALIASDKDENCYVAPTSFGKSSLIVEVIKFKKAPKVSIIVPTKSLLIQTYRIIKNNFPGKNIIFHDEMYDGADEFVSIFTQERALRFLKDEKLSFDLLIIDEAHNLFDKDSRSLLLTRLIRRNRLRNPRSINYYLSPLISDVNNLKVDGNQDIFERRVFNNIKEADIFELKENGEVKKYNRFLDEFFGLEKSEGVFRYIKDNAKNKNFLYLRAPKRIEEFSIQLASALDNVESVELDELSKVVSNNVHEDFYCVDYIKKGLVYLHGKLPDLLKEYLEFKFSKNNKVRYIVANSVILEGVNLPVDNLYILNVHALDAKSLTNLIGRVNRLNEVFDDKRESLDKLLPHVHFINSEFNRKNGNMANSIRKLKSGLFKDSIENPLLVSFNIDKVVADLDKAKAGGDVDLALSLQETVDKYNSIQEKEDFLVHSDLDADNKIKKILLESNVLSAYFDPTAMSEKLESRASHIMLDPEWDGSHVVDKVYLFFIKGFEAFISKQGFLRLQHEIARAFYKKFTQNLHRLSLKEHISETIAYFQSIKHLPQGREFYIGASYGEFPKLDVSGNPGNNLYIDLSAKTAKELANIALVKIKIENDFVSYDLNSFVNVIFDLELISEEEYQLYIYGTTKKRNSEFVKLGLSGALINKLDRDEQIGNLSINEHGVVEYNDNFIRYIERQDDLIKFEIGKYIDI